MFSPYSAVRSFKVGAASALTIGGPAVGATGVPQSPTLTWASVDGVQGYEVQLGTDPTFAVNQIVANAPNAFYAVTDKLDAGKTYYWRVRAITGANPDPKLPALGTPWVAGTFTVAAAAATTAPTGTAPAATVTVTPPASTVVTTSTAPAPPASVVTIEVPTPTAIPTYLLWIIIAIGIILVIALIVLIVRTRRVA
jgi:hypothetical protein